MTSLNMVAPVNGFSGGTNTDAAINLSKEKFTHGVMTEVLPFRPHLFDRPDVVDHILAVPEELVDDWF